MGITVDFLFKHVRPYQLDGVEAYFSDDWRTYVMGTLSVSPAVVSVAAQAWTQTALSDPDTQQAAFITTATIVTDARGQVLYRVPKSTILFLNADQLSLLSNAGTGAGANKSFVVDFSADPIVIAVTINNQGVATVARNATGISVATDASGNIVHLAGLAN